MRNSVAAQISNNKILKSDSATTIFNYQTLSSGLNYCSEERFSNNPIISDCTGFLVSEDLLMTAGHCMADLSDCTKKVWVFDYDNQNELFKNEGELSIPKNKIYGCKEVVTYSNDKIDGNYIDYALVRLDRKVTERDYLKVKRFEIGKSVNNAALIGHPLGLPKILVDQITLGNSVGASLKNPNMKIDSDSFSGNSGSPIIDLNSGQVIGMLIRGDMDFEFDFETGCNRTKKCTMATCKGETMLNYSSFPLKQIPFHLR